MNMRIRTIRTHLSHLHALAAPASTLLWASILTMILGFSMRVAFGKPSHRIEQVTACSSTAPGESIQVSVQGDPNARFSAYLPGLTTQKVALSFDEGIGQHVGSITVPGHAPHHGYLTLRVVSPEPEEKDQRIRLRKPSSRRTG